MKVQFEKFFVVGCLLLILQNACAYEFNTGKVINASGSKKVLAEDEGYLYLSFETNSDISRITLDGEGIGNKIRFNDIKRGDNHALVKLKAGKYSWEYINIYVGIGLIRYDVDEEKYAFEVKPGVVNYPGSWWFTGEWAYAHKALLRLQNYNFLSYEVFHFKKHFSHLIDELAFEYQGKIKDPYNSYLFDAIEHSPLKSVPNLYYRADKPSQNPMTVFEKNTPTSDQELDYPNLKKYFQKDSQLINAASKDGRFLLFSSSVNGLISIGLIGVEKLDVFLLYQQQLPSGSVVSELDWIDKDSLFLTLSNQGVDKSYVGHLSIEPLSNAVTAKFIKFKENGWLLDGLINEENQLLFVKEPEAGKSVNNTLYKVDISSQKSMLKSFKKIHKNTKSLKNVVDWLVDKNGKVRAAISAKYNKKEESTSFEYWFLSDANNTDWKKIRSVTDNDFIFLLKAISEDEKYFLVLTNEFSDYRAIHKFSTIDGSHLGVFYENPQHDINDVLIDRKNQALVGYTYIENGLIKSQYLIELEEELNQAKKQNSDLALFKVESLKQQNRMLLFGINSDTKGAWYLMNTLNGVTEKIFDVSPEYERLPKGQLQALKVKANDGVEIEGFLMLPDSPSETGFPLVVMPHGGPIGAQDTAHNNELQQFLASQGVASLKVNFRGSSGYGKKFQELGKQQWGEKIEQDIHAVTEYVIKNHKINPRKICSMGGSYGGYSALMLAYLYPETYLCAISFAGVMDLPLLFTSKDLSREPEMQAALSDIVGDPVNEIDKLVKKSPLYLLDEIKQPLLIVQGVKDQRVRVEHALRMQQLISVYGLAHEVVLFKDEGHAITHNNTLILYLHKSIEFIKNSLEL